MATLSQTQGVIGKLSAREVAQHTQASVQSVSKALQQHKL
jgi:hypothetical protein